jgi:hypothetical protein
VALSAEDFGDGGGGNGHWNGSALTGSSLDETGADHLTQFDRAE